MYDTAVQLCTYNIKYLKAILIWHYLGLAASETRCFFILPTFVFAAGFARFAFCANWFGVVALALFVARNLVRVLLHGENSRSFCDFLSGRSRRLC